MCGLIPVDWRWLETVAVGLREEGPWEHTASTLVPLARATRPADGCHSLWAVRRVSSNRSELAPQCTLCRPCQGLRSMMHLKRPRKQNKREKKTLNNFSPIGPSEKCQVPKDPTYPLCAEKVEVRMWNWNALAWTVWKVFCHVTKVFKPWCV